MLYLERYEADGKEAIETHVTDRDRNGNIRERVEHVPTSVMHGPGLVWAFA